MKILPTASSTTSFETGKCNELRWRLNVLFRKKLSLNILPWRSLRDTPISDARSITRSDSSPDIKMGLTPGRVLANVAHRASPMRTETAWAAVLLEAHADRISSAF
jgi:hypothetical protein